MHVEFRRRRKPTDIVDTLETSFHVEIAGIRFPAAYSRFFGGETSCTSVQLIRLPQPLLAQNARSERQRDFGLVRSPVNHMQCTVIAHTSKAERELYPRACALQPRPSIPHPASTITKEMTTRR